MEIRLLPDQLHAKKGRKQGKVVVNPVSQFAGMYRVCILCSMGAILGPRTEVFKIPHLSILRTISQPGPRLAASYHHLAFGIRLGTELCM